jgi:predicted ribonuclease YlaK
VILKPTFHPSDYEKVATCIVCIEEIDGLKNSSEIGYKARDATKKIKSATNIDIKINYDFSFENRFLQHRSDNFILGFAYQVWKDDNEFVFLTDDFNLYLKAKALNIPCDLFEFKEEKFDYKGYKVITMSPQEMSNHYSKPSNIFGLLNNEYLLIKDEDGTIVDQQRWNSKQGFIPLNKKNIKPICSKYLDDFKSRDAYQMMAIDSLNNMDFTLLFGVAGSAKSLLSLSWIMQSIENQKITKCVIIYNSVPLKNSQVHGYYTGDRTQKLLQTSLGGILSSKFGSMNMVEDLIADGKLLLIPTSEIRGLEISEHDCVYVTEAQNIDTYTMRTIIQRAKGKIIIEGDILEQKDLRNVNSDDNGMLRAIEVFKGTEYFSCVKLKYTYRSLMCELAQQI